MSGKELKWHTRPFTVAEIEQQQKRTEEYVHLMFGDWEIQRPDNVFSEREIKSTEAANIETVPRLNPIDSFIP